MDFSKYAPVGKMLFSGFMSAMLPVAIQFVQGIDVNAVGSMLGWPSLVTGLLGMGLHALPSAMGFGRPQA